jgi:hypothetical protein
MTAGSLVALAAVLYQPAFAALTRWYRDRQGIRADHTHSHRWFGQHGVSPLTAALAEHLSWRPPVTDR